MDLSTRVRAIERRRAAPTLDASGRPRQRRERACQTSPGTPDAARPGPRPYDGSEKTHPGVGQAASAVVPCARAELNLRFHPLQDPREARGLLVTHLEALRPFGIALTVTAGDTGPVAEVLLFGAQATMRNLHAPDERVLFSEIRSAVIAEAAFLREFAAGHRTGGTA